MTSVEFLKLLRRRWYVLLLGLALTGALSWFAAGPNIVYFSRTTVNILQPDRGKQRIVGFYSPDDIAVAHILAARVNNGVKTPLASSPDVELYAMGITDGSHAQIRNVGGQWLSQVKEPVVDIQAVGPNPQQVRTQLKAEVTDLQRTLSSLEDELKVSKADRIQLSLNPVNPDVSMHITQHSRALMAYGLVGLALSLFATWWVDGLLRSRAGTRRRTPGRVARKRTTAVTTA